MIDDTIAAISSGGKINQAISIIRVSGKSSIKIVQKVFDGKIGKDHSITYGHILDPISKEIVDEVLCMWYIGNNNFTGEDTVEINCHGGVIITNRILEIILASGARMALPGEFSRRSFLNGKMDLIKAEAINDLIHAQTLKQSQLAIKKFDGYTSKMIKGLIDELAYLIGQIEINIDYPEYTDFEDVLNSDLYKKLDNFKNKLSVIIQNSENSRLIFDGIKVAIVGRPNVGKSSLLNCLIGEEKAIVTNIAGTTRDIVEAQYLLDGFLFKLIDTAGIRKTTKTIEKVGIDKALEQIQKADLVIHLLDAKNEINEYDKAIDKEIKKFNKTHIVVINKKDLLKDKTKNKKYLYISAKNNDIENLKKQMVKIFKNHEINNDDYLNNTRQLSLIKKAYQNILEGLKTLEETKMYDLIIVDLRRAWANLTDISGRADNEMLLDDMFKNFCLGK